MLCRNVVRRLGWPRFRNRLVVLEDQLGKSARPEPATGGTAA
jgi:hypothetical protein